MSNNNNNSNSNSCRFGQPNERTPPIERTTTEEGTSNTEGQPESTAPFSITVTPNDLATFASIELVVIDEWTIANEQVVSQIDETVVSNAEPAASTNSNETVPVNEGDKSYIHKYSTKEM